jgi:kumamolisin
MFNDVTSGDNNITGELAGYRSGIGWDACTGIGSPRVSGILGALG